MIDIYLENKKTTEENSYDVITIDNVDAASFTDDENYLILYSTNDDDSIIVQEIGRFKNTNIIGYNIN